MKPEHLEILIAPDSGEPLQMDASSDRLITPNEGRSYILKEEVPILLPRDAESINTRAVQHEQMGSDFHYVDHYQRDAEVFDYFQEYEDPATRHENRRLHETIIQEVPTAAQRILDVGCGNAWVASHFCPLGKTVCSMDIALVNTARALKEYPFENHFAVVADVFNLPFKPASFDCIIAAEIIEHVADPAAFLGALIPMLRPGGKLIVTTPFNERIQYSLCIHCNRPTPHHAHLHSFTESKMLGLLSTEQQKKAKAWTFGNKALIILPTHKLLKFLSFGMWRLIDRLANRLLPKPSRIILTIAARTEA